MRKLKKLWSVPRITHPEYPGITLRILELKPGGPLSVCRMVDGRQQMKKLNPACTRKDLGPTPKAQEKAARARAAAIIARLAEPEAPDETQGRPSARGLTLGSLVDRYEQDGFVGTTASYRRDQVNRLRRIVACLGPDKLVVSIDRTDLQRWIVARRGAVRQNTIRGDLHALSIACNWALDHRPNGVPLLEANPLARIRVRKLLPRDPNVRQAVADQERYAKLRAVAHRLPPAFGPLLDLAWWTGLRRSAILGLRWQDVGLARTEDAPEGTIRWYADSPTSNKRQDTVVPMRADVRTSLVAWQKTSPGVGRAWVFPADDPAKPLRPEVTRHWLARAEKLAKLPHLAHGGWHAFRRGWATVRKDLPLKDLMSVGIWRDETSVLHYVAADPKTRLAVVNHG